MVSLCFDGPQEALDLTVNTQMTVLTVDIAAWLTFSGRMTTPPIVMAGHSLGEYAALYAAGAVDLRDVLALIHLRAKYHQEAVPVGEGAMAAILGLPRDVVEELCRRINGHKHAVTLSIENAPGQIVVSGHTAAIEEIITAAEAKEGGRAVKLAISVPCHCHLLQGAAERFAAELRRVDFRDCTIPVIPNYDPDLLHSREQTRELLARQITSPVRWKETIEKMAAMGVDTIVELGAEENSLRTDQTDRPANSPPQCRGRRIAGKDTAGIERLSEEKSMHHSPIPTPAGAGVIFMRRKFS